MKKEIRRFKAKMRKRNLNHESKRLRDIFGFENTKSRLVKRTRKSQ